ncbi:hypothetical protein BLOT_002897 [Blomia tropicalis]|nr:hypothetical protein BLOT_002897 [Blomia tropicalis]
MPTTRRGVWYISLFSCNITNHSFHESYHLEYYCQLAQLNRWNGSVKVRCQFVLPKEEEEEEKVVFDLSILISLVPMLILHLIQDDRLKTLIQNFNFKSIKKRSNWVHFILCLMKDAPQSLIIFFLLDLASEDCTMDTMLAKPGPVFFILMCLAMCGRVCVPIIVDTPFLSSI